MKAVNFLLVQCILSLYRHIGGTLIIALNLACQCLHYPSSQLSEELTTKLKEYLHLVEKTSVTMEQEGVRRSYMSLATY